MDGKFHSLMTVTAAITLPIGYLTSYGLDLEQVPSLVVGNLLGLFINPDLDVDRGTISDYYIRKIFGTDFFYDIWLKPYRKSIKHRSFWSHTPIIGTLIRLLYILCPVSIFLFKDQPTKSRIFIINLIFAQLIGFAVCAMLFMLNEYINVAYWVCPMVLGLIIADTLHWLADRY